MGARAADDSERFAERYALTGAQAQLAVEREALGADYQGNGYTTIAQADELGRVCELGADRVLADIGAGCGWPGLYLASRYGCLTVSVDRVQEGVDVAARRAAKEGLSDTSFAVCGDATHLPLRSWSVDAVIHTDLIC